MRGYECFLYYKNKEGKLEEISNTACFAGISRFTLSSDEITEELRNKYNIGKDNGAYIRVLGETSKSSWSKEIPLKELTNEPEYIYIKDFKHEKTSKHIKCLINNINKVTDCCVVKINDVDYIKYKLLKTYDQNLILLNFIRNLWYSPFLDYDTIFFSNLHKIRNKDGLKRMTRANKASCLSNPNITSFGHSNVSKGANLKLKTKKDLLEYNGLSTHVFLTT